jgi:hypothetical protein
VYLCLLVFFIGNMDNSTPGVSTRGVFLNFKKEQMKAYTWEDVSVFQYQQLMSLYAEHGNTELDILVRTASIITGMTEHEVDSLPFGRLQELGQAMAFTSTKVEPRAVHHITAGGNRYRFIYDVRDMPAARYIESSVYSADTLGNLHRIAASMVMPQRRSLWGVGPWRDAKYVAARHADYAQDMLEAPITAVLGSVLFFCEVYLRLMWSIPAFSLHHNLETMAEAWKIREGAAMVRENLCASMGGIIKSSWSLDTKVFPWEVSGN